jgi:hypothetical protein
MPINKNHEFEDLDGIKCAVVERNADAARVTFVKSLLEYNGYEVVVVPTPVKPAPAAKPAQPAAAVAEESSISTTSASPVIAESSEKIPPPPETFTIGVTDVMFNATNAIFGRLLRTVEGHVVTLAFWQQRENISNDEVPYFQKQQ